jgi:hypothetical protein
MLSALNPHWKCRRNPDWLSCTRKSNISQESFGEQKTRNQSEDKEESLVMAFLMPDQLIPPLVSKRRMDQHERTRQIYVE